MFPILQQYNIIGSYSIFVYCNSPTPRSFYKKNTYFFFSPSSTNVVDFFFLSKCGQSNWIASFFFFSRPFFQFIMLILSLTPTLQHICSISDSPLSCKCIPSISYSVTPVSKKILCSTKYQATSQKSPVLHRLTGLISILYLFFHSKVLKDLCKSFMSIKLQ